MSDNILSQISIILKILHLKNKFFFILKREFELIVFGVCIFLLAGCSVTRSISQTDRSFLEQVMITQSIESSLGHAKIPLPKGSSVQVVTAGLTDDKNFAVKVFEAWLGRQGYKVLEDNADYQIQALWRGIGTDNSEFFFGIPPISSGFIPIATPELSFYKSVRENAVARLSINITKRRDGQLIYSTPAYEGKAYYNVKTILFGFTSKSTNLAHPPPE